MNTVTVNGKARTDLGKKATKAVRKDGGIPCVMYGAGDPVHFVTNHASVKKLIFTPEFQLADISVGGGSQKAIIKSVQYHPVTENIEHIDFLALVDGQSVKVDLPVRFRGVSPGVLAGGRLTPAMRRVKVKTVPESLVNELVLDISSMELGSAIRVRDIDPVEGIEIMSSPSIPVATVEVPRALRSAATAAAKEGEEEAVAE
jgi:large subunit ribosomal protein L25